MLFLLLLFTSDIRCRRQNTYPHDSVSNLKDLMTNIKHDYSILVEWSRDNYLTLNTDKCHVIVSGYKYEAMNAKVGDASLWEEHSVKVLGLFL